MNSPPSDELPRLLNTDIELLSCLIAAPTQTVAAEWLDISPTHLRRRLTELRDQVGVETNSQLIVLASVDPVKVLPYTALL